MASEALNPITWVPYLPWMGVAYIIKEAQSSLFEGPYKLLVSAVYLSIYLIASFWQSQVTRIVPEPYLDEVFHVPQAQAYCVGDFHIWDPKLTTPPGLYGLATIFGNLGGIRSCDVFTLRLFNTLALIFTMSYASSCHGLINRLSSASPFRVSPATLHTAFNIALFPPLFFFSGLFYTDVLSTCLVLRMYKSFLQRERGVWLYVAGILALSMRQTNIFWVAIYMGGSEVVRTLQDIPPSPHQQSPKPKSWKEATIMAFDRYSRGEIHDIPLKDAVEFGTIYSISNFTSANWLDFVLCAISIAVAALYHPIVVLSRLWPYVSLLVSFGAFVFWNGGVVLGDKSNHVATIHLAQLLYLWPFISFFSVPLLLPSAFSLLSSLVSQFISLFSKSSNTQLAPASSATVQKHSRFVMTVTHISNAFLVTCLIIKFNTLIHPFTLADNRHYVFYIFRYTILRHPLIRYLLAPAYMLSGYLTCRTLSNPSVSAPQQSKRPSSAPTMQSNDPKTSFLLIFILSTALSLITAPLVEPRYFIIPWVIWRLHVPASPTPLASQKNARKGKRRGGMLARTVGAVMERCDVWLWGETFWFLLINAVTGYVFLYRGFEWPQEPGNVQRFMW